MKNCQKKKIILRVPQRHAHRHFKTHLKALTVLWQPGLWCSIVLPFWPPLLPMGKYSGGEQKRWFLPTPSATLCPALAAPATPAAPACSPQHCPGGNTALSSMVGKPTLHSCQTGGQDSQKWKAVEFYEASSWS